jgi:hypothetical protein
MAVRDGNGGGMVEDLDTFELEWRDEQLQRARAVFESVDSSVADADLRASVVGQLPAPAAGEAIGVHVFRDLLRVEHRPDRFQRLLRIWSGKIGAAIREGEFALAGAWMRALTERPVFAEEFASDVAAARKDLSRPDLFMALEKGLVKAGNPDSADSLLAAWGEPLVDYLIGQIVVEEPIVNRRHIVEHLGMAGRGDVRLLTARLADPRWFVVRNVATAIGKTGRSTALPSLEGAIAHKDDRVRVEVLRSIAVLKGDDAVAEVVEALSDPSPKVRQAAASLLRSIPSPDVVPAIVDALERGVGGGAEDSRRLVEVIGERRGEHVREALERLASKKFALGASKAVKDAARAALEGWTE